MGNRVTALMLLATTGFLSLGSSNCASLKYQHDLGFLNSAQANSMESIFSVNGMTCVDLAGFPGQCSLRTASDTPVKIHYDPRPYPYRLDMRCPTQIPQKGPFDVDVDQPLDISIEPGDFATLLAFTCLLESFPLDDRSDQEISALGEVHVTVYDEDYERREQMLYHANEKSGELTFGRHALWTRLCSSETCKFYNKKTIVPVPGPDMVAYSESYMMRFNRYGF